MSNQHDDIVPAPPVDAGALDMLDLDDIFSGEGDLLDGLEMDLMPMDQLAGSPSGGAMNVLGASHADSMPPPPETAPMPPPKSKDKSKKSDDRKQSGPRTAKRPPPLAEPEEEDTPAQKRRKTKRKPKNPAHWDDDEGYSPSPVAEDTKKKKQSLSKKGKQKKKKDAAATPPQIPSTKKSKLKSLMIPSNNATAISRGSISSPASSVAAAGQFGSRLNKRGAPILPLNKNKSKKKAAGTVHPSTSTASDSASVSADGVMSSAVGKEDKKRKSSTVNPVASSDPVLHTMPEPTFCGLSPSNTIFYPFMESMPPEPSLKNKKAYPIFDRIFASLNQSMRKDGGHKKDKDTPSGEKDGDSNHGGSNLFVKDTATLELESLPIYRLLVETYEHSDRDKSTFHVDKLPQLGSAIHTLRSEIKKIEKSKLVGDMLRMCGLLKRQHDFLLQNMENMERWTQDNLSAEDYKAAYHSDEEQSQDGIEGEVGSGDQHSPQRRPSLDSKPIAPPSYPLRSDGTPSFLPSWPSRNVKVKLKLENFNEPKNHSLVAMLPAGVWSGSPMSLKSQKKKRSSSISDPSSKAPTPPNLSASPAPIADPRTLTYAECSPSQRRQRIMDRVSSMASRFELLDSKAFETHAQEASARGNDAEKMVKEDVIENLHTTMMWKWLKQTGWFDQKADVEQVLDDVWFWCPEEKSIRELAHENLKVPLEKKSPLDGVCMLDYPTPPPEDDSKKRDDPPPTSSHSLFNRLQSLLVDENVSGDEDSDDETLDDDSVNSIKFVDGSSDHADQLMDISGLTLDERTYVHLRKFGLVSLPPASQTDVSLLRQKDSRHGGADEDDLGDIQRAIEAELRELSSSGNGRLCSLRASAQASFRTSQAMAREGREIAMILMQRQARMKGIQQQENQKKHKKKTPNDSQGKNGGEYALPW